MRKIRKPKTPLDSPPKYLGAPCLNNYIILQCSSIVINKPSVLSRKKNKNTFGFISKKSRCAFYKPFFKQPNQFLIISNYAKHDKLSVQSINEKKRFHCKLSLFIMLCKGFMSGFFYRMLFRPCADCLVLLPSDISVL